MIGQQGSMHLVSVSRNRIDRILLSKAQGRRENLHLLDRIGDRDAAGDSYPQ